jgi:hypothetical protein
MIASGRAAWSLSLGQPQQLLSVSVGLHREVTSDRDTGRIRGQDVMQILRQMLSRLSADNGLAELRDEERVVWIVD